MGFVRHILVGLMMFAAMACERRESIVTQFSREKILLKGNGTEPRSLDLHLIQEGANRPVQCRIDGRIGHGSDQYGSREALVRNRS